MNAEEITENPLINWHLWCRLCAKDDIKGNINVFMKNEQSELTQGSSSAVFEAADLTLPTAIGKYFWVNITKGEELPEMICSDCLTLVTSLVNFSDRIARVQKFYCTLQATPKVETVDLDELRSRFGLLDEPNDLLDESLELENPLTLSAQQESNIVDEQDETIIADGEALQELCDTYTVEEIMTNENNVDDDDDDDVDRVAAAADDVEEDEKPQMEEILSKRKKRSSSSRVAEEEEVVKHKDAHECPYCQKVYAMTYTLQRHINKEHSDAPTSGVPMSCLGCDKSFSSDYLLNRHMLQCNVPKHKRKIYPCQSCDKKFTSSASALAHAQYMHEGVRHMRLICEQCGTSVLSQTALKEHMLTHTDYAPYECEQCKKCFKSKNRLKLHKDTHDPHKYICPECGKQLNSRPTLNRHRLVHTEIMNHKCDYCGRQFKRAKALKNHLILHTGLKPYTCDFCDRTFANGSNCRTHKKKAHPEELAELEAAGGKAYNRDIPKLEALKAFTKNKDNLSPVATKNSGCFAFGKKPKLKKNSVEEAAAPSADGIPTIDTIYDHIMKPTKPAEMTTPPPPTTSSSTTVTTTFF